MREPPRHYSVGQKDYDPDIGGRLRILVDGVEQRDVISYDCDAGTVLKYKLDGGGMIVLNKKRDEAERESVRGLVAVEWKQ